MKRVRGFLSIGALLAAVIGVQADSVEAPDHDDSVAAELASFKLAEGYEINLFASEENGIANPITMRWDARGRLWVLCSLVYPQIVPTEKAEDRLFILEDTDGDGRADETKIFVEGLDMPTGFALGDGGVYLGEGHDLVFWRDTDGDDRGDSREVIFSGFGTGDTHQNINSFTWSPGGELFFCQGLHGFARVETPWGIVGMEQHGVWRMRPRTRQLHAFRGGSSQNPWGVAFDDWGQPFVKGGSGTGLSELLPIMVPTEHFMNPIDIGNTQIKSMIVTIADSPHLPEEMRGDALIAGYFGHTIDRMRLETDGAGHRAVNEPALLRSSHRSFRPVDIQIGPDGAIYVADWYNPIIGHYQASFRHPDRDKTHGRIWRITAQGRPLAVRPKLEGRGVAELLESLKSPERFEREQTRQLLSGIPTSEVSAELGHWIAKLEAGSPDYEHQLYEALGVAEWHEHVDRALLGKLLEAKEPLARAYAVRVAGRWSNRIEDAAEILTKAVGDSQPRVRLEAVVASSYLEDPDAIGIALRALDQPMDRFLEAALVQTCHALKPLWWPALTGGTLHVVDPRHLAFALKETSGQDAAVIVRGLLDDPALTAEVANTLMGLLSAIGTAEDVEMVLSRALENSSVLQALADAMVIRGLAPKADPAAMLSKALASGDPALASPAIRLAGIWEVTTLAGEAEKIATDAKADESLRVAAVGALRRLLGAGAKDQFAKIATEDAVASVRAAALAALAELDLGRAARVALARMQSAGALRDAGALVAPFIGHENGLKALAEALRDGEIPAEKAGAIIEAVHRAGASSEALAAALGMAGGASLIGYPEFSQELVNTLTDEVKRTGDGEAGRGVYSSPRGTCSACHRLGSEGGTLGPELTAVGAGLPIELLVEAVLWPSRQVKEGYLSTTLRLDSGKLLNGYLQTENAERIVIRDAATGITETVAVGKVSERKDAGTLMPQGLASWMTRKEFVDLLRFLSERKGG
jgi:putative heme-binding domain-containing protein